ncbi:NAD(P)/FAD-dependent oxidoreductase [Microaceticoccus formicicus]|uniref:NAD(P)/FAD-dependent oxidoreductase n=1 Tax=Microaceticoccus formicicus TaxID=3118105 RepID=UPI003CD00B29|nr:NAD(P)/FAD-dependent oxidoreductase [Peptoniphilaceae bacterium AMB_02]
MIDVIIIGGGPAGVAAANYARARGLEVLLFEKNRIGGLITLTTIVSHYPGLDTDESGESFGIKLEEQLNSNDTKVIFEKVEKVELEGEIKTVYTSNSKYEAKTIIIATGSEPKLPPIDKTDGYLIKPNVYEKIADAKDKEVFVLGGSDGACKEAISLARYARRVHIVQNQNALLTIHEFKEQIENNDKFIVHTSSELESLKVDKDEITEVNIIDIVTGKVKQYADGPYLVFAYIGQTPNSSLFIDLLEMEDGYIKSDGIRTSIPGVYSCGDINVKEMRQISTAVSDGTLAGIEAYNYIRKG